MLVVVRFAIRFRISFPIFVSTGLHELLRSARHRADDRTRGCVPCAVAVTDDWASRPSPSRRRLRHSAGPASCRSRWCSRSSAGSSSTGGAQVLPPSGLFQVGARTTAPAGDDVASTAAWLPLIETECRGAGFLGVSASEVRSPRPLGEPPGSPRPLHRSAVRTGGFAAGAYRARHRSGTRTEVRSPRPLGEPPGSPRPPPPVRCADGRLRRRALPCQAPQRNAHRSVTKQQLLGAKRRILRALRCQAP
jgi:hypothetical protein